MYGRVYDPSEVVVLHRLWGGVQRKVFSGMRLAVGGNVRKCKRSIFPPSFSSTIIQDGKRYIGKYLRNGANRHYLSLILRMEYFAKHQGFLRQNKTKKQILSITEECFDAVLRRVNECKAEYGLGSLLVTMDHRKQGSTWFINPAMPLRTVASATDCFYHKLNGNSSTLEEWDESFESVASFRTPGYIALLQKHLAANGDCLLTVGGGTFQGTTLQLYMTYHPSGPKCAGLVSECFPPDFKYRYIQ